MTREKRKKTELDREEYGADLSPDDLDFRRDNEQTEEQVKNSNEENKNKENNC
ncbi:hypothetical protein ACIQZG_23845 [Lysinibacillus sp. NPDC096418]|uniref:hypothetical protein n=1 Tax=Lysinibacillus sp. NPDC096418 TaxID=3364138 RepID=UPI00382CA9D3